MASVQTMNGLSLPATSASFDTVASRTTKNAPKQNIEENSIVDSFSIDCYTHGNEPDQKSSIETKKKNFSELLATESKRVINFSDCTIKENFTTCELTKNIGQPAAKRRKLKMLPIEFNEHLSGPSTSSSANTECTDSSQKSNGTANETDKKTLGKVYLKEVSGSFLA